MSLETFLNQKPLYYETIDYTRMPRAYESIKDKLKIPNIIHVIGTNGKGTTGRFLASALFSLGYKVGHYTSPHIYNFNERIWLDGENVSNELLNISHQALLKLLSKDQADSLSYFEYTTLLAMHIYQDVDYVVLEAGLGGEFDATAVFENILTLVTPIGIDHEAFLGDTITKIATTKLNAVQKKAILGKQIYGEVYEVADSLVTSKKVTIQKYSELLDAIDCEKIVEISQNNSLVTYLEENLSLSIAALKVLNIEYEAKNFSASKLFGRLSAIGENVLLDVGHNVLAAQSIYESLKKDKYTLVYNSYKDKNYKEILTILKPIIDDIEIIEVNDSRILSPLIMAQTLQELGFQYKLFKGTKPEKKYLVFGSFSVAEAFLKGYCG